MASEHGLHFSVVLPVEKKEEELEGEDIMRAISNGLFAQWADRRDGLVIVDTRTQSETPLEDQRVHRHIPPWTGMVDAYNDCRLETIVQKLLDEEGKDDDGEGEEEDGGGGDGSEEKMEAKPETFFDGPGTEEISEADMPTRPDGSGKKAMQPIDFPPGVNLLAIIASMGLGHTHTHTHAHTHAHTHTHTHTHTRIGKTHTTMEYLGRLFTEKPHARVLFVSSNRIQQAHTFMSSLKQMDFTLYSDVEGNVAAVDRLVIQYESLLRIVEYGTRGMNALCSTSRVPSLGKSSHA
jgi:hypothetical protein